MIELVSDTAVIATTSSVIAFDVLSSIGSITHHATCSKIHGLTLPEGRLRPKLL